MDDKVAVLLGVCRSLVTTINLPLSILQITGLGANIWDLGEDGVKEVTKSSWHVAYALLTGGWTWEKLLEEQFLIDTVKRNVKMSQMVRRLDSTCSMLIDLGFTDEWLY